MRAQTSLACPPAGRRFRPAALPPILLLALLALPGDAAAQIRASERGTVSQVVDGTRISVDYSRPVARGREDLFGGVVHWGEVWTPGANHATVLELSHDVRVDGRPVPAGRWSMWLVVSEDEPWELVLDPRAERFHTQRPEPADDQIRFPVRTTSTEPVEVLTFSFPELGRAGATLTMAWGTTAVPLEIEVEPTPIPTIAAEQAAPYLGDWEVRFHMETGEISPLLPFGIRFEPSGSLIAGLPWEEDGRQVEMMLIPRVTGVFLPAFLQDGEVFDVETFAFMEFEEGETGGVSGFAVRTEDDQVWISGQRAVPEPVPAEIEVPAAELARYVGAYGAGDRPPARVTLDDAGLWVQAPMMGRLRLAPIGPATFRPVGVSAPVRTRVEFESRGEGVVAMTLRFPGDAPAARHERTADPDPESEPDPGAAAVAGQDEAWLIASAVLALPEPLRDGAEVRGWTPDGGLVTLRPGSNGLVCLADRPEQERFAAACYHEGLEAFMERGRQLVRDGIDGARRNQIRWREIESGTLAMPPVAMVYNLWLPSKEFDPAGTDPATGSRLHALYIPFATAESTGLSTLPGDEAWLMEAGTPSAHVMIAVPPRR